MKVRDLTWRPPVTIDCGATIAAAAQLLTDEGVGALVVLDGDRPVGVVTDRDLVTRGIAKRIDSDARIATVTEHQPEDRDRSVPPGRRPKPGQRARWRRAAPSNL